MANGVKERGSYNLESERTPGHQTLFPQLVRKDVSIPIFYSNDGSSQLKLFFLDFFRYELDLLYMKQPFKSPSSLPSSLTKNVCQKGLRVCCDFVRWKYLSIRKGLTSDRRREETDSRSFKER